MDSRLKYARTKPKSSTISVLHELPMPAEGATGELKSNPVKVYCEDGQLLTVTYSLRTKEWKDLDEFIISSNLIDRWEKIS